MISIMEYPSGRASKHVQYVCVRMGEVFKKIVVRIGDPFEHPKLKITLLDLEI
jgi:hypothetical protein